MTPGARLRLFAAPLGLAVLVGCAPVLTKLGVPQIEGRKALDFIATNSERSALVVTRNDTVLATINGDRPMPLASTAKVIIAIEYAHQATAGDVDPAERVSLEMLERFHVPRYDGGAHDAWLASLRSRHLVDRDRTVSLHEVVRGMIRQSSNANAEWLLERLGLDRVNARALALDIRQPTPLYYAFSSALLILRDTGNVASLRAMSSETWVARATAIHDSLRDDVSGVLRKSLTTKQATFDRQRVWSDRLPSASAGDYAHLADRIASRRAFAPPVQTLIERALDGGATAPSVATLGFKGGSSATVFTLMTYILRTDCTRTSYAVFFNDLSRRENAMLQRSVAMWSYLLETDADFRERIAALGRRSATLGGGKDHTVAPLQVALAGRTLERDERIRLTLWPRAKHSRFGRQRQITGRFAGQSGDTLFVKGRRGTATKKILARDIATVYRGTPDSRLYGSIRGAIVSAAQAALLGAAFDRGEDRTATEAAGRAAIFGALEGAIGGAIRPRVHWRLAPWSAIDSTSARP